MHPSEEDLRRYLDEELSEADRAAAIEDHLQDCPQCLKALQAMVDAGAKEIAAALRRQPVIPAHRAVQEVEKVGKYTLGERIGAGGMGIVYLAQHDVTGHRVAVKLIHPARATNQDATRRFLEEMKILGKLDEDIRVVRIHDGGIQEQGGRSFPYIVMDHVRGDPIDVYNKEHALGLPKLLDKFLQACEAIRSVHDLDIIHCDLKPQHILIDAHGFPRVLDFGLARLLNSSLPREAQQVVAGTPAYMSPEQATGEYERIDERTDVYALGIILFELLATGRRPYEVPRWPPEAFRCAILEARPTKLGEINSDYRGELEDIITQAIQKDPKDRYQSVKALEDALRRYLTNYKPCNLPLASIGTLFKGRAAFLDDLRTRLGIPDGRAAAIVNRLAVHGLGGVGKTRAAVEYAWRHADEYTALLFVSAPSASELRANLANLVGVLGTTAEGTSVEQQLAAVLRWLDTHPSWLLIIDNVNTDEAAREVEQRLARLRAGHVLITSRIANWSAAVEPLELDVLAPADAVAFLLERTSHRRKKPDDAAVAAAIAGELDGLALALEQAGAYIDKLRLSLAEYLQRWEAKRPEVLGWHDLRLMQYPASVAVTWETTFVQLEEPERRLLEVLSWLAPEPIPLLVFDATPLAAAIPDPREALAGLAGYSLARDAADEAVLVHRLVQEITGFQ